MLAAITLWVHGLLSPGGVSHAIADITAALGRLEAVAEHHEAKRDAHDAVIQEHIELANAAESEAERARAIHSRISALVA